MWEKIFSGIYKFTNSIMWREFQWKIVVRFLRTPHIVSRLNPKEMLEKIWRENDKVHTCILEMSDFWRFLGSNIWSTWQSIWNQAPQTWTASYRLLRAAPKEKRENKRLVVLTTHTAFLAGASSNTMYIFKSISDRSWKEARAGKVGWH